MLFLQIRAQRNRAKVANCHPTTYPIRHQIHVDTTTIRQVRPTITTRIWETVNILTFSFMIPPHGRSLMCESSNYYALIVAVTPNSSSIDATVTTNNNGSSHINASSVISADSSVASSVSLDEEDESPAKVKKKDDNHVNIPPSVPHSALVIWCDKYVPLSPSLPLQNIKKEICAGPKGSFYNSFEMQQRRDISAEPYPTAVTIGNGQPAAAPPNNSAIHNYGPTNQLPPPPPSNKATNAKNRFSNSAIQDGGSGGVGGGGGYYGFYGKQPSNADYYGKYEVEFAAHHRKTPTVAAAGTNQMPFNHQPKGEHFAEQKSDFHHIKNDFPSGNIKADLAHQKALEFQHGKMANFHANQQGFYNHPSHNVATVNGQNVDANHQVPIQYASQYYSNEYGGVAPGDMDATAAAAYYEQKASHPNYYENMYHHGNSGEYNAIGNENPYGTTAIAPPSNGQLPGENCDSFMYPQYFEGNQNAHPNHQTHAHHPTSQPHQQHHTGIHQTVHGSATATINISHGHNQLHQTAQQQSAQTVGGNFTTHSGPVAPPYHHMQHTVNGLNGNQHIINMENSNSSSDFNFLSNLANDFAPEYYQLS